jgi:uncharacterized membrane protein
MSDPAARTVTDRLGAVDALDTPARTIASAVNAAFKPGSAIKRALSGAWLGHALHPILTDVPIGTWTSATLLDVAGGRDGESAAELLIGAGLAVALPTLWSGWSDWSDEQVSDPAIRRIGLVHAATNGTATGLFAASLIARRRGQLGRGKLLGLAGSALLGAGGYLGGHLSYAEGSRVEGA